MRYYVQLFSHVGERIMEVARILTEVDRVGDFTTVENFLACRKTTVVSNEMCEGRSGDISVIGLQPLTDALPSNVEMRHLTRNPD